MKMKEMKMKEMKMKEMKMKEMKMKEMKMKEMKMKEMKMTINVNQVKKIFSRLPQNLCFVSTTRAFTLGVRLFLPMRWLAKFNG
jgi:hypothetical protein